MKAVVIIIVLIVGGAGAIWLLLNAADDGSPGKAGEPVKTASGLEYLDKVVGKGRAAKSGDTVAVFYTGRLIAGSQVDSNRGKKPLEFTIDESSVIQGWHEGIAGMKEGGVRILAIPPALGYGSQPQKGIPANSVLIFEVELVKIL